MGNARRLNLSALRSTPSDEAFLVHAALVVVGRDHQTEVDDAVAYLYAVSDKLGVDRVELARLVVQSSERRVTGHE